MCVGFTRKKCSGHSHYRRLPVMLSFILCSALPAVAATYYVSPQGSDSNPGTSPALAWSTLAHVNRTPLQPGDRVLLQRSGVWHEELEIHGGSAAGRVLYGTYGTGTRKPVLDGATPLSHWTAAGDGVYTTSFTDRAGKIFIAADPLQEESPLVADKIAGTTTPQPGTFSQSNGSLYIHLKDNSDPTSLPLEVSSARRRYGAQSRDQSFFTIDGIAMVRTYNSAIISSVRTPTAPQGHDITVRNCYVANFGTPYDRHANDNPGDAGEAGIYLAGPHDRVPTEGQGIANIAVEDNEVGRFDSHGVLDYDRAGIQLRNAIAASVKRNKVHTITAMGIHIADNYNNRANEKTVVANNDLSKNQGNISIAGCESCEASNNTIHDSAGYGIGVGTGMFAPAMHTFLRSNTIANLLPSNDGTLYNGVDCNAGSSNGTATGNHIEAVANYSFTLEADKNAPCAGWTLAHNTLDARSNGMWNKAPTGRRGALYVQVLSLNGLQLQDNTILAYSQYPQAVAYGSRNSSDRSKDIVPGDVPQVKQLSQPSAGR